MNKWINFNTEQKVQQTSMFVTILFFLGLFVPTTIYQWMQNEVFYFIPFFFFLLGLFILKNYSDKKQILLAVVMNLLLWIFTIFSPLRFSFGEAVYYIVLFLMVTSVFQLKFDFPKDYQTYLVNIALQGVTIATSIILIIGFGIIGKFRPITNFVIGSYPYFYDGLVESMVFQGKPVISFGTHSLAGFYLFLFFVMNLFAFVKKRKALNLIYSLFLILMLLAVKSTTSLLYLIIALVSLLVVCYYWKKPIFIIALSASLIFGIVIGIKFNLWEILKDNILGKDSLNGLSIRYRKGGVIYNQIVNILKNPLVGTGTRSVDGTFYIDCGITHVGARTGVLGIVLFYAMFFRFIKNNISNKVIGLGLFLLFFSFEIGFANLLYFRTVMTLPFILFFMTVLAKEKNELFFQEDVEYGKNQ